jgi:hypothetical protein
VNYAGLISPEFFDDTACGTFVSLGGVLYGPANVPAGPSTTPYITVSQSGPTGAGTATNPFTVQSVVALGATGVRLVQIDTYTAGSPRFQTTITVQNTSAASITARVYRAGDCFVQIPISDLAQLIQPSHDLRVLRHRASA